MRYLLLTYFILVTSVLTAQITFISDTKDVKLVAENFSDTQRDSLQNVVDGRIIFNTTTNCLNYFAKGKWYSLCGTCMPQPPLVPVDSVAYQSGILRIYFNEQAAINNGTTHFQISILPFGWTYETDHSPFSVALHVDTTITVAVTGKNECGTGVAGTSDPFVIRAFDPCGQQNSVNDSRDGKTYELVSIGNQCWIKGYLQFVPGKIKYVETKNAVFYEWQNFATDNNLCPSGFHVPDKTESEALVENFSAPFNQYTTTESYDMNVTEFKVDYLGGYDNQKELFFQGSSDFFWVSQIREKQEAYIGQIAPKGMMISAAPKNSFMPIRCIKDKK